MFDLNDGLIEWWSRLDQVGRREAVALIGKPLPPRLVDSFRAAGIQTVRADMRCGDEYVNVELMLTAVTTFIESKVAARGLPGDAMRSRSAARNDIRETTLFD